MLVEIHNLVLQANFKEYAARQSTIINESYNLKSFVGDGYYKISYVIYFIVITCCDTHISFIHLVANYLSKLLKLKRKYLQRRATYSITKFIMQDVYEQVPHVTISSRVTTKNAMRYV